MSHLRKYYSISAASNIVGAAGGAIAVFASGGLAAPLVVGGVAGAAGIGNAVWHTFFQKFKKMRSTIRDDIADITTKDMDSGRSLIENLKFLKNQERYSLI